MEQQIQKREKQIIEKTGMIRKLNDIIFIQKKEMGVLSERVLSLENEKNKLLDENNKKKEEINKFVEKNNILKKGELLLKSKISEKEILLNTNKDLYDKLQNEHLKLNEIHRKTIQDMNNIRSTKDALIQVLQDNLKEAQVISQRNQTITSNLRSDLIKLQNTLTQIEQNVYNKNYQYLGRKAIHEYDSNTTFENGSMSFKDAIQKCDLDSNCGGIMMNMETQRYWGKKKDVVDKYMKKMNGILRMVNGNFGKR